MAVAADEIAIATGLVAFDLNAEEVGYLLTVAVEGAHAEFLAVNIARRLRPVITNLLYRHAATLQLANQPTIKLCPVVHSQYSIFNGIVILLLQERLYHLVPVVPGVADGWVVDRHHLYASAPTEGVAAGIDRIAVDGDVVELQV